jgi:inosose dehydratase
VDFPDEPGIPSWQEVLDGIAKAGYRSVELGPYGFLPADAAVLREALWIRDLRAAGGLLYEAFHDPGAHDDIRALGRRVVEWVAQAGGEYVLLIPVVNSDRDGWAGRASEAPALDDALLRAMAGLVDELAKLADAHGLTVAVHPHAGSYVETLDEFEALMSSVSSESIGLCIDTGHCLYSGIDPVQMLRTHADIVAGFHLKDLDRLRLRLALQDGQGFDEAVGEGVFRPLGQGDVDFAGLAAALEELQIDAWATVEQDIDPDSANDPVRDAMDSRRFLERTGLADAEHAE